MLQKYSIPLVGGTDILQGVSEAEKNELSMMGAQS